MFQDQLQKFYPLEGITYLNCAYMSPMLKSVEEAGVAGIAKKRNPAIIVPDEFFNETEVLRQVIGQLIDTKETQRIVTIPSVSYGMANVMHNLGLKKGENIILSGEQFPSNYYPWKKNCDNHHGELKIIKAPEVYEGRAKQWNETILEAINNETRAVAIAHVHWADGTKFDLKAIRQRTNEVGAALIIDGTQSIGALPFSIEEIQPDALICAGYKWLFGPYSLGFAYYGEYFDNGSPIEENWINRKGSENFAGLVNYQDDYQPASLRYEVGEHSNFVLVPMLLEAVKQVYAWSPSKIQEYCKAITEPVLSELDPSNFFIESADHRSSHLLGIRFRQSVDMDKLSNIFKEKKIVLSIRGDAIRISTHIFNSQDDLYQLTDVLKECIYSAVD